MTTTAVGTDVVRADDSDAIEGVLVDQLDATEASRLAELENDVQRGAQGFLEMGKALTEIRDSRLYRAAHQTFENYCSAVWSIGRAEAYELIKAAAIVSAIADSGATVLPANVGQTRAVAAVPEKLRPSVWAKTVETTGGKPTAAAVSTVHREIEAARPKVDKVPAQRTVAARAEREAQKEADRIAAEAKAVKAKRKEEREAAKALTAQQELAATAPDLISEAIAEADPTEPWVPAWTGALPCAPWPVAQALRAWLAWEGLGDEVTKTERHELLGDLLVAWLPLGSAQLTVRCAALNSGWMENYDRISLSGVEWMEAREAAIVRALNTTNDTPEGGI